MCVISHFSHVRLFVTQWTVAPQAPLSMGILQDKEYWNGLPCPPLDFLPLVPPGKPKTCGTV